MPFNDYPQYLRDILNSAGHIPDFRAGMNVDQIRLDRKTEAAVERELQSSRKRPPGWQTRVPFFARESIGVRSVLSATSCVMPTIAWIRRSYAPFWTKICLPALDLQVNARQVKAALARLMETR